MVAHSIVKLSPCTSIEYVHVTVLKSDSKMCRARHMVSLATPLGYANNKGTDQPAHPRSLTSAFVTRLLERIISKLATSKISIFYLVYDAEHAVFVWSESPKTGNTQFKPLGGGGCCLF